MLNSTCNVIKDTDLVSRIKDKMLFMKPVFTYAALNHLYLLFNIRVRVRPTTRTVLALKIMVIRVFFILDIFACCKFAEEFSKFRIATITPELPLGPKFYNLIQKIIQSKRLRSEASYVQQSKSALIK